MSIVNVIHIPLNTCKAPKNLTVAEWAKNVEKAGLARYERLKAKGHPVEWYPVEMNENFGSPALTDTNLLFAFQGTHLLEALEPNSPDAIVVYEALERFYAHWLGKGDPAEIIFGSEFTHVFTRNRRNANKKVLEAISPTTNQWMGRSPRGIDRTHVRPQRNLPVLRIELPEPADKAPTGTKENIIEAMREIGFSVVFKN
jgi:hypothetical protein